MGELCSYIITSIHSHTLYHIHAVTNRERRKQGCLPWIMIGSNAEGHGRGEQKDGSIKKDTLVRSLYTFSIQSSWKSSVCKVQYKDKKGGRGYRFLTLAGVVQNVVQTCCSGSDVIHSFQWN